MVQYAKPDSQAFLLIEVNSDVRMVQYAKPAIQASSVTYQFTQMVQYAKPTSQASLVIVVNSDIWFSMPSLPSDFSHSDRWFSMPSLLVLAMPP